MTLGLRSISDATLDALVDSRLEYLDWAGDYSHWYRTPEYLATTKIANTLREQVAWITLEDQIESIITQSGGSMVGAPNSKLNKRGRFDMVIWTQRSVPKFVIEVKAQPWAVSTLYNDMYRICETLKRAERIKYGLIAYSLLNEDGNNKKAEGKNQYRTDSISQSIKVELEEYYRNEFRLQRISRDPKRYEDTFALSAEVLAISLK